MAKFTCVSVIYVFWYASLFLIEQGKGQLGVRNLRKRVEILEERVQLDATQFRRDIDDIYETLNTSLSSGPTQTQNESEPKGKNENNDERIMMTEATIKLGFESEKRVIREALDRSNKSLKRIKHEMDVHITNLTMSCANVNAVTQNKIGEMENKMEYMLSDVQNIVEKNANEHTSILNSKLELVISRLGTVIQKVSSQTNDDISLLKQNVKSLSTVLESLHAKQSHIEAGIEILLSSGGFVKHDSSYYYFGINQYTWHDAQKQCTARGMHGVEIDSKKENDWLKQMAELHLPYHKYGFWSGGSDEDREGHWVWAGSNRAITWGKGQFGGGGEDNHRGNEHCLHLWRQHGY